MILKFGQHISMEYPKLEGTTYIPKLYLYEQQEGKSVDISLPINQLQLVIDSLQAIKNENGQYFDEL